MTTLGERLKEAREALGLSQVDVAQRAGVSPGTIGNLEAGTRKAPRELLSIAAAVNVRAEWLKTGRGQRAMRAAGGLSDAALELAELFDRDVPEPLKLSTSVKIMNAIRMAAELGREAEEEQRAAAPTATPQRGR